MRVTEEQSRAILGHPEPPVKIWEHQFDYFDAALERLGRTPWRQIEDRDLWYYINDLGYIDLQPELFAYLFPACLNFWYRSLLTNQPAAQGGPLCRGLVDAGGRRFW